MWTFSTKHEKRADDSYIVRGTIWRGDVAVYSHDVAFYIKDNGQWFFGAISREGTVHTAQVMCPLKKQASHHAGRLAMLILKATVADKAA
jgi:hypothetical protein